MTGQLTTYSHPFVECLIGTIRREFLDQTLFWNAVDLGEKFEAFQNCTTTAVFMLRSRV
jgi:hypothetical protein